MKLKLYFLFSFFLLFLISVCLCYHYQDITTLGTPIEKYIAKNEYKYFRIKINFSEQMSDNDKLNIVVTCSSGDVDLYVRSSNFPSKYCTDCWKSSGPHGDRVVIQKTDEKFPTGDDPILYVAVYSPLMRSNFQINTYLEGDHKTHITIENGKPQSAHTPQGGYTFFKYHLSGSSDITFSVTPESTGDPDLYISTINPEPTPDNYTWKSIGWGEDTYDLRQIDPGYKPDSDYYIGVGGYSNVFYTLSVVKTKEYQLLLEGVPMSGNAPKNDLRYFKFYLTKKSTLNINVKPSSRESDPDVYVTFGASDPKPSPQHFRWRSRGVSEENIVIKEAEHGWYYIAVFGYKDSKFKISATSENVAQLLLDSQPIYDTVGGPKYKYFKFYNNDEEVGLTISLQPTATWGCSFWVGTGSNTRPTRDQGKYQYKPQMIGKDSVLYLPPFTGSGNYYIGVHSWMETNFTITAQTNQTYYELQPGEIVPYGHVPVHSYRYYIFDVPLVLGSDVVVSVKPTFGEVSLFASTHTKKPKHGDCDWESDTYQSDSIIIPKDDPKLEKRRIYISVYGQRDSSFAIVGYFTADHVKLESGHEMAGIVRRNEYQYYVYEVPKYGSVSITLKVTNPNEYDADLFVSTHEDNKKPNALNYEYRSQKFGDDFIKITHAYRKYVYIGVYGASCPRDKMSIEFTINVHQDYMYQNLNGASSLNVANKGEVTVFHTSVYRGRKFLSPTVTLISGKTSLYASNNGTIIPSEKNYIKKDNGWPGNVIGIERGDPNKFETWSFAVVAEETSSYFFGVSSTDKNNYANVHQNIPRLILLSDDSPTFIRTYLAGNEQLEITDDHYINIRMLDGNVEFYVTQDHSIEPNPQNFTWSSKGHVSRLLKLEKDKLKHGPLHIGIYGKSSGLSKVEIVISKGETPKILAQEQPLIFRTKPFDYDYFRVLNAKGGKLKAYCDSCSNQPAPVMFVSNIQTHPTELNYTHVSSFEAGNVYRSSLESKVEQGYHVTYLSTHGGKQSKQNDYEIFATTGEDSRPTVHDKKIEGKINGNGKVELRFTAAVPPQRFKNKKLIYSVFYLEIQDQDDKLFNTQTPCGIRTNMKFYDNTNPPLTDKLINFEVGVLDLSRKYVVSVIAYDENGLSEIYDAVFVIRGKVTPKWFYGEPVSLGLILLLALAVGIIGYFVIGVIINLVRRKKRFEIIPNFEFWVDLPFLLWDGIKFVIFLGGTLEKKVKLPKLTGREKYKQFNDEGSINSSAKPIKGHSNEDIFIEQIDEVIDEEEQKGGNTGGYGTV